LGSLWELIRNAFGDKSATRGARGCLSQKTLTHLGTIWRWLLVFVCAFVNLCSMLGVDRPCWIADLWYANGFGVQELRCCKSTVNPCLAEQLLFCFIRMCIVHSLGSRWDERLRAFGIFV